MRKLRLVLSSGAVAATLFVTCLAAQQTSAQVIYRQGPDLDDGDLPDRFGPGPFAPRPYGPRPAYREPAFREPPFREPAFREHSFREPAFRGQYTVSRAVPLYPGDISDILSEDFQFRRVGRPRFGGRIYTVDGIDRVGASVRVYMDAFDGRLIDVEILRPAARDNAPGRRDARLPDASAPNAITPLPPRRPATSKPSEAIPDAKPPEPRQAARPSPDAPVGAKAVAPTLPTPVVPLTRTPRVVDPNDVRLPGEADRSPPLARPAAPQPQSAPQAQAAPPSTGAAPTGAAPGSTLMVPAPLDDAVRKPTGPESPAVPAAPLL